ncbi:hypothetical protein ABEG17_16520 [Pedococcus sp. KACC 23699]|uniref:YrhK domain-containing protein n=1 Tax=Pedococcus sp. KACC 23699 TaxID=3149228 RepID=A0AAU7JTC5_9MICO
MSMRPERLNATVAWLFMAGSACFVVGSVPAYLNAVGGWADGVTYVVGSVFFTSASYGQLVQAQSPATTAVDTVTQHQPAPVHLLGWAPHDRGWLAAAIQFPGTLFFNISTTAALAHNATAAESNRYVWRPDIYGSVLFLVSSAVAVLAVSHRFFSVQPKSFPWRIAWLNMAGSVLFMASAIASYLVPSTDALLSARLAVVGTLTGALCFLAGAALMLPAWRRSLAPAATTTPH